MNLRLAGMLVVLAIGLTAGNTAAAREARLSDEQIIRQIIQDSIASYSGNCACPFNRARNGSACGKRSARSRAGGESPLCYKEDVTQEMIDRWRETHP